MPQPSKGPRLGGSPAHQRLMLANLATSLFTHGRITTTQARARKLRPYAERLITKAKRGDLHNRREIQKVIRDKDVVHRLLNELGPLFESRNGGYTRITKTMPRKGDNAPMAVIELITSETVSAEADRARRVAASQQARAATATEETTAEADEATQADAEGQAQEQAEDTTEASAGSEDAPYGEGSHAALPDGGQPEGFPVKGVTTAEGDKQYHVPGSSHYDRTVAEVWFANAEAAESAGFQPSERQDEASDETDGS